MPLVISPMFDKLKGILLIMLLSFAAFFVAEIPLIKNLSLSPLIVGIIIGMIFANTLRKYLPATWVPGVIFCSKTVLRAAIIFYGFRLTFQHIVSVGVAAIVIDVIIVVSVIFLGIFLGKLLKIDSNLAILASSGSAICGAAAVLGTEPVLKDAKPFQTAVAVTTVVIFGTISMFLYPALYKAGVFDLSVQQVGIYTGATLHEVAHVVGAGNAMNDHIIANSSIIVKMTRVMLLVPFLLILNFFVNKKSAAASGSKKAKISIPWFAFGFLLVIAFNSLNLMPQSTIETINILDNFALTMAMTALGAESNYEKFKQAGTKPFVLAFLLFLWLFFFGYFLVKIIPPPLG